MKIFGIINLSPDSFLAKSRFLSTAAAINQAKQLIKQGAYGIDLGAQASNPAAKIISTQNELNSLIPVINKLKKLKNFNTKISIDSPNPKTQIEMIQNNIDYINDINGFNTRSIYSKLAQAKCKLIVMHKAQTQTTADYKNRSFKKILASINNFFDKRLNNLIKSGVKEDRIIIDPGMGLFLSSDPYVSIKVLDRIPQIKREFNKQILISCSHKSFLRTIANVDENNSLTPTIICELFAVIKGVDYIRTHCVGELNAALRVWHACVGQV